MEEIEKVNNAFNTEWLFASRRKKVWIVIREIALVALIFAVFAMFEWLFFR